MTLKVSGKVVIDFSQEAPGYWLSWQVGMRLNNPSESSTFYLDFCKKKKVIKQYTGKMCVSMGFMIILHPQHTFDQAQVYRSEIISGKLS